MTRGRRGFMPFIGELLCRGYGTARQGQSSPLLLRKYHTSLELDRKDYRRPPPDPRAFTSRQVSLVVGVEHSRFGRGSFGGVLQQQTAPLSPTVGRGAPNDGGSIPRVIRQQIGIEIDLALRDRPPLLVVLDRLHAPGIRIVVVQAVSPVALVLRVATHQVEPAPRLVREVPVPS